MTQEDKQLLLVDLCARLPYGVECEIRQREGLSPVLHDKLTCGRIKGMQDYDWCVKPYLRPMSSMTEEEKKDLLVTIVGNKGSKYFQVLSDGSIDNTDAAHQDLDNFTMHWINFDGVNTASYVDWCNKNMFDYRGLIPKSLAIEAPDGMYN